MSPRQKDANQPSLILGIAECVMINLYFAYSSANYNFLKAKGAGHSPSPLGAGFVASLRAAKG